MKGIILAGGTGSRLMPLTKVTNKHLLPIYDKPMIYYPLQTLIDLDIKEVMIVSGRGHAGHFLELLGSGAEVGVKLSYAVQEKAGGIAEALGFCEDFAEKDPVCVILGDNIFENPPQIKSYKKGAMIFLKEVGDARRFGVATLDKNKRVVKIVEKPVHPETNYAVIGFYVYDNEAFKIIKTLKPSARGELEITDVNNEYIKRKILQAEVIKGYWTDAGTFETLFRASELIRGNGKKKNL